METTQSESRPLARKRLLQVATGLLLALGAFLFGGFMALPAVLAAVPPLRRFWPAALALFAGTLAVRGLTLIGVNPVLSVAREQALAELAEALGGEVSYDTFEGDATLGELRFTNLRATIPDVEGEITLEEASINAGWFMLHRPQGYIVTGSGLVVRANASEGRLEKFMHERRKRRAAEVHIEGGRVEVFGSPTTATLELARVKATVTSLGWEVHLGLKRADVSVIGQTHRLDIYGGLSFSDDGSGLSVSADLSVREPELGMGIVRGQITPQGGSLSCTLDQLNLGPLWARYRKVDSYAGVARGHATISGTMQRLVLALDCEVTDFEYFHFTAMGLDREHAFALPQAWISGRVVMLDGEHWELEDVTVKAPSATLATGEVCSAVGGGTLVLRGRLPSLTGSLDVSVQSGRISRGISWSTASTRELSDVEPNIIKVGEQFGQIALEWKVDLNSLELDCEPLKGTLSGSLAGTFTTDAGKRIGTLRAGGELEMTDGRVKCLGLTADFGGKLIFNPNAPTYHATLRGSMTGRLGDTPIDCEVTGDIKRPGFVFKGAGMGPEELGRKIYSHGWAELTPAQQLERGNQLNRIFGPSAVRDQNPFSARGSGSVFFSVK